MKRALNMAPIEQSRTVLAKTIEDLGNVRRIERHSLAVIGVSERA